jgi:pSer/pThr/pTyr-binding forkhead associated (FHA) protein
MIGETISLTKPVTVMGRNPELADVVFYPDEPSSLSRVHATIQLDGKYFVITDSNSTNGTRVNGQLLRPSDPVQLRDGDEIVLGDLGKLGVKMRFAASGGAEHTELKDRTYIVDDYDQQDWDMFRES